MKKAVWIVVIGLLLLGGTTALWWKFAARHSSGSPIAPPKTSSQSTPISSLNKSQYSLTDPTSIWVIVNKQHPLQPLTYAPSDLVVPNIPLRVPGDASMQVRQVTAVALQQMFAAAKTVGINLMLASGYRSYTNQLNLYNRYVQTEGQAITDTQSARAGYSEHQTGLAADIEPFSKNCEVDPCFGTTPEGKWLAANAYKYGFIIRYTAGNQAITGYEAEPWHVRYVGVALANQLRVTGIQTLEQFFHVQGGTTYAAAASSSP